MTQQNSADIELGQSDISKSNESESLIQQNQCNSNDKQCDKGDKCCKNDSSQKCSKESKPKKKKKPKTAREKFMICGFVALFPFLCVVLETTWICDIIEYEFDRILNYIFMWFFFIMSNISYYKAITIKNDVVKRRAPEVESTVVDPEAKEVKTCKGCNDNWKPPRSHHCSTCGACQTEMDHHCPWVVNCVGYRNHRAFGLFTIYMTCGGLQYCYRSWNFFYYLYEQEEFFGHSSTFMYCLWGFCSLFLFPGTLLLLGLTGFHTGMVLNNTTTIDVMGGQKVEVPCLPENPNKKIINVYDRGVIANLHYFFQGDLFTFWYPKEAIGYYDGTQIPRAPYCNLEEISSVLKEKQQDDQQTEIKDRVDVHQMSIDLDQKIESEKHNYKDFNFQIQGKIYEYWKIYAEQQKQLPEVQQNNQQQQIQQEYTNEQLDIQQQGEQPGI